MNRRLITPVIALIAAGSLVACGGDDDQPGDTPVTTVAAPTTAPTDESMTDESMTDESMTDDSMTDTSTTVG